jgi:deazaflavin-dependent oxidoreductase (nitroreductase family)
MAIPRFVRPFTRHVVNPITRRFAGRMPWFGQLTVVGRTSGRSYTIPINVFRHQGRYVFALTYGSDTNWVKNVVAADGATIRNRGRVVRLRHPRLFTDPKGLSVPRLVGLFLRATGVEGYLEMEPVP